VAAAPRGLLSTTITTSRNGEVVQETGTGTYQVFSDCSGGSLTFNLESGPVSYNFFFGTSGDISLVGTDFGDTLSGLGKKGGPGQIVTKDTVCCGMVDLPTKEGSLHESALGEARGASRKIVG
jgi:hypothetical protein